MDSSPPRPDGEPSPLRGTVQLAAGLHARRRPVVVARAPRPLSRIGDLGRASQRFGALTFQSASVRRLLEAQHRGLDVARMLVRPPDYWSGHRDEDLGVVSRRTTGDVALDRLLARKQARRPDAAAAVRLHRGLPSTVHRRSHSVAGPLTAPGGTARRLQPAAIVPAPNPANSPQTAAMRGTASAGSSSASRSASRAPRAATPSRSGTRRNTDPTRPAAPSPTFSSRSAPVAGDQTAARPRPTGQPVAVQRLLSGWQSPTAWRSVAAAPGIRLLPLPAGRSVAASTSTAATWSDTVRRAVADRATAPGTTGLPVGSPAVIVRDAATTTPTPVGAVRATSRRSASTPVTDQWSTAPTAPAAPSHQPVLLRRRPMAGTTDVEVTAWTPAPGSGPRVGTQNPLGAAVATAPGDRVSGARRPGRWLARAGASAPDGQATVARVPMGPLGPVRWAARADEPIVARGPLAGGTSSPAAPGTPANAWAARVAAAGSTMGGGPVSGGTAGLPVAGGLTVVRGGSASGGDAPAATVRRQGAHPAASRLRLVPAPEATSTSTSTSTASGAAPAGPTDPTGTSRPSAAAAAGTTAASASGDAAGRPGRTAPSPSPAAAGRTGTTAAGSSGTSTSTSATAPSGSSPAGATPRLAPAPAAAARTSAAGTAPGATTASSMVVGAAPAAPWVGRAAATAPFVSAPGAVAAHGLPVARTGLVGITAGGATPGYAASPGALARLAHGQPVRRRPLPDMAPPAVVLRSPAAVETTSAGRRVRSLGLPATPAAATRARTTAESTPTPSGHRSPTSGGTTVTRRAVTPTTPGTVTPASVASLRGLPVAPARVRRAAASPDTDRTTAAGRPNHASGHRAPTSGGTAVTRSTSTAAPLRWRTPHGVSATVARQRVHAADGARSSSATAAALSWAETVRRRTADVPGRVLPGSSSTHLRPLVAPPAGMVVRSSVSAAAAGARTAPAKATPAPTWSERVAAAAAGRAAPTPTAKVTPLRPSAPGSADRFQQVLRSSAEPVRTQALPVRFRPLADRIIGRLPVQIATGVPSQRALAAVGTTAATTGNVIHLPKPPDGSARSQSVLAHELTHVAAASPVPRFHGGAPSIEETAATQVERIVARAARSTGSGLGPTPIATRNLPVAGFVGVKGSAAGPPVPASAMGGATSPGSVSADDLAARLGGGGSSSGSGTIARSLDRSGGAGADGTVQRRAAGGSAPPGTPDRIIRRRQGGVDAAALERELQSADQEFVLTDDQFDAILAALEDRLLAELERRGGLWRGGF